MASLDQLVRLLADGEPRTIASVTQTLSIGPEKLKRLVAEGTAAGLSINRTGDQLGLERPLHLLSAGDIAARLPPSLAAFGGRIEVHGTLESTNVALMNRVSAQLPNGISCFAEFQSAGRGRRGRRWFGAYASNVLVSVYWAFGPDRDLGGLSLAVGVGVARAVRNAGATSLGLKWPNDLVSEGRKVAGILVETRSLGTRRWGTVTGVGVNLGDDIEPGGNIEQPWTSLSRLGVVASRSEAAATVLGGMLTSLEEFDSYGLRTEQWSAYDILKGKAVRVMAGERQHLGIARGIDRTGALLVETSSGITAHSSGEVSVRVDNGTNPSESGGGKRPGRN